MTDEQLPCTFEASDGRILEFDLIYDFLNKPGWSIEHVEHCSNHKIKYFEFKNDTGSMRVFEYRTELGVDTLINLDDISFINEVQHFIKKYNAAILLILPTWI